MTTNKIDLTNTFKTQGARTPIGSLRAVMSRVAGANTGTIPTQTLRPTFGPTTPEVK